MNAAVIQAFDAPPRYTSFTEPVAGDGEMLVNVVAAGLHPIVKALASGSHYGSTGELPFVAGLDGVGRLADGKLVFFGMGRAPFGTFAERSLARRGVCLDLPAGIDPATAAALMNPGMSSWAALRVRAQFAAGESVLILGATGVAGRLAVQVAKRLGARRVIAAGRNPAALEKLKELGADSVVSLEQDHASLVAAFRRELTESAVDVVLDYLWGGPAEAVLDAISQRGMRLAASRVRWIQVGESAGSTIALRAGTLRSSALEILGSGFGSASLEEIMRVLGEFLTAAGKEPFQINVRAAPLRDVETLWNSPEQGTRIVFQP